MAAPFAWFDPTPFVRGDFAENAISPSAPAKGAKAAKVGTGAERFSKFSCFSNPTPAELKKEDADAPEVWGAGQPLDPSAPAMEAQDGITWAPNPCRRVAPLLDDGPTEPCAKCGGRNFWRPSGTSDPWRCRACIAPHSSVWCDGVFLPPAGAVPTWPAPKKSNERPAR